MSESVQVLLPPGGRSKSDFGVSQYGTQLKLISPCCFMPVMEAFPTWRCTSTCTLCGKEFNSVSGDGFGYWVNLKLKDTFFVEDWIRYWIGINVEVSIQWT